jgi:hypothetical protein
VADDILKPTVKNNDSDTTLPHQKIKKTPTALKNLLTQAYTTGFTLKN